MFWQDALVLALMDDFVRAGIVVGLLVMGFFALKFIKTRGVPAERSPRPVYFLICCYLAIVFGIEFHGLQQTATGIRAALSRPGSEIEIRDGLVIMRAPVRYTSITAFGRTADVYESEVVVDFPIERLSAVEKAIEQDEMLRAAYATLRRSTNGEMGSSPESVI